MINLDILVVIIVYIISMIILLIVISSRRMSRVLDACYHIVASRFLIRKDLEIWHLIKKLNIPSNQHVIAKKIIEEISNIIGVPSGKLRLNDKLGDILKVEKNEINFTIKKDWEKCKFSEYTLVYVDDIFDFFLSSDNYEIYSWIQFNSGLKKPRNEDQWINLMNKLTLEQLITVGIKE